MSETVRFKGKLKVVELINNDIELTCKTILKEKFNITEIDSYNSSWYEQLFDTTEYEKYFLVNNVLYESIELNEICYDDSSFIATLNNDNTIDFDVMYYNGGCSFSEAVEHAIDGIK